MVNILQSTSKSSLLAETKTESSGLKKPTHMGLVPDGNRRWAKQNGMPYDIGYTKAVDNIMNFVSWCGELDIKYLSIWAFSTENFQRDDAEKTKLFKLLENKAKEALETKRFDKYGIRVRFIGELEMFPSFLTNILDRIMDSTKENNRHTLSILLGYGGRQELLNAAKHIANEVKAGNLKPEEITEETISSNMYTKGMPDPDIVIRTSEARLSGFMPWQSVYSELYFVRKYWPEFTRQDLMDILQDYSTRSRRFGK